MLCSNAGPHRPQPGSTVRCSESDPRAWESCAPLHTLPATSDPGPSSGTGTEGPQGPRAQGKVSEAVRAEMTSVCTKGMSDRAGDSGYARAKGSRGTEAAKGGVLSLARPAGCLEGQDSEEGI